MEASPDLLSLAKARFAVRDYHGAALLLTSLTQERPAFADAFNLLGLSLALVDCAPDALVAFDQALRVNPRYVEAYLNRASSSTSSVVRTRRKHRWRAPSTSEELTRAAIRRSSRTDCERSSVPWP